MSALQESQQRLAKYIRDPDNAEAPSGIELRRLKIYNELFYNNIEGFLGSGFPVLRDIFSEQRWHAMVRDFMLKHPCHKT